jgi:hypothetical protein
MFGIVSSLGFGQHLYDLTDNALLRNLRLFYIAEIFYVLILGLVKISLLLFYLRIFPYTSFRIAAWSVFAFIIISDLAIIFLTIFSCKPVRYFWNKDIHGGKCINITALAYANGALAIAQDVIILVLPLIYLPRMNMHLRKKIGVAFMFVVGSFGCITSMVRMKYLAKFGNSIDPTWDYVDVFIWTALELAAGFVCACLPSIRNLLSRTFPRVFRGDYNGSGQSYNTPPVHLSPSYSFGSGKRGQDSWRTITSRSLSRTTTEREGWETDHSPDNHNQNNHSTKNNRDSYFEYNPAGAPSSNVPRIITMTATGGATASGRQPKQPGIHDNVDSFTFPIGVIPPCGDDDDWSYREKVSGAYEAHSDGGSLHAHNTDDNDPMDSRRFLAASPKRKVRTARTTFLSETSTVNEDSWRNSQSISGGGGGGDDADDGEGSRRGRTSSEISEPLPMQWPSACDP